MTAQTIQAQIEALAASDLNTMNKLAEPAFGKPLVGFGNGADPLFDFYRKDIGAFLLPPDQWLTLKYGKGFEPKQVTVISWVLPQTEKTKQKMKRETELPTYEWALVRTYGEAFNRTLGQKMEAFLEDQGICAVAPLCNENFQWEKSEKYGYASNWSERHAAMICGLGTFGLCDGLISPLGKAVRYGSVIAELTLPATRRPYQRYNEYCMADRGCRACIDRCPAGAVTEAGHDKEKCSAYQQSHVIPYAKSHFDFEGIYGCGLCQTGVPCESCIPDSKDRRD